VRRSSGGWLDPSIAAVFVERGSEMLAEIDRVDALTATLAAEPEPWLRTRAGGLDATMRAFADMVDLQSPYTLGHSPGVAGLAEASGARLGLDEGECAVLLRAALLHDLGRVGVPAGTWEKPGPLNAVERERVRLHPYYTERILMRSPALAAEAAVASRHHERLDGSGYHRGVGAREQSLPARILAAADAYQTMTERRPHRDAQTPEQAADRLVEEARAGRLDAEVVEALLAASGEPRRVPRETPADLSEREVEVLRLIAAGRSNGEIAEDLVISRRTAEHHVQHIYAKIGVSTRPGATLFALEHGLLTS
jgi:HD-GYP domain-containing protein (c-di-GMP phosphodiesterase class II)